MLWGEEREIMKNVVLNNGVEMPMLGFGVYRDAKMVKMLGEVKLNA